LKPPQCRHVRIPIRLISLFQIILMHAMNREIMLGRKKAFDGVLYEL